MKKYIRNSVLLIFLAILMLSSKANAASVSAAANKTSLNVGDEFKVNINLSSASVSTLTVKLSVDTTKVEYVSGPTNSNFSGENVIYTWTDMTGGSSPLTGGVIATFTFRAKATGTAQFSITGDFYDTDENSINMSFSGTSVTINESASTSSQTSESPSTTGTQNSSSSESINNSTTSTTTLSSNANLQTMQLDVEGISPEFSSSTTEYFLVVDETVDAINVFASPQSSSATISIAGNEDLQSGSNKILITVTAQNGTQKVYTINVTKTNDAANANANLENLAIENATLTPEFSADIVEYTAEVESDVEILNILAIPQIEDATVKIEQPELLSYGENIITITVFAADGETQKIYTINVTRKEAEEIEEKNQNSKLKIILYIIIPIIIVIVGIVFAIRKYKKTQYLK